MTFDLIVVGGGAAGLVAAVVGASLGADVALVERERLGGECTWRGCIPSKALLHIAHIAHAARAAGAYGLAIPSVAVDWPGVRARLDATRETIYERADSPAALSAYGIQYFAGDAAFVDRRTIRVRGQGFGETLLAASRTVICTGSEPTALEVAVPYLTSDTVFDIESQPQRLLVVGSGPVAIELGQAFCRLGSSVRIVSRDARILVNDDPDHARELHAVLQREGVGFTLGSEIDCAREAGAEKIVRLTNGEEHVCDAVLVAIGRTPRIAGYGLDAAGVTVVDGAIRVDRRCRTSAAGIYAAGDVTGAPFLTHAAEEMSKVAVANALLRIPRRYEPAQIPWCTYTSPELAHAGLTEERLRERNLRYSVFAFPNRELDRAIVDGERTGGTKLFVDRRGRLVGASILGARAGEVIGEMALAVAQRLPVSRIANTVHPYPSYGYGPRRAADEWYVRALTPFVRGCLRAVFRLGRWFCR